ncbi:MAG TPA: thermonuclease family protein [Pyrinomonadaceae bacterium]|nr:thermonuclease family protein [Pyrinomonadaceae bacterium]
MKRCLAIALLIAFCLSVPVMAGTLQGMAVEIHNGKTLSVENAGRRIKVVLKSADVPEADQPYSAVARQHLSDLVLGKLVTVEYTGIAPGAVFIAKVYSGDRDISLQMIRDGVAWFTDRDASDMSDADRALFAEAEQAARTERRGLWQDPKPVSPWEWRRARTASSQAATQPIVAAPPQPQITPTYVPHHTEQPGDTRWPVFAPNGSGFSIRMPRGGRGMEVNIQNPNHPPIDAHLYFVKHLKISYIAVWTTAPSNGETVNSLFDRAKQQFEDVEGASHLPCEFVQERDTTLNGFVGRRYKIQGCYFYGGLRLYFKAYGAMTQMYLVGVMSETPNDPLADDFLNSFEIHQSQ